MPDHVHILIRKHKHLAEEMIANLQEVSRLRLGTLGLRPENHPVWTGGAGWKVFLDTPDDIRRTIPYIELNPTKMGLPRQVYSFVKEYDGWPLHPGHSPNSPYAQTDAWGRVKSAKPQAAERTEDTTEMPIRRNRFRRLIPFEAGSGHDPRPAGRGCAGNGGGDRAGAAEEGDRAEVLLLSHLPTKYSFIFRENQIPFIDVEAGWPETFPFERFDMFPRRRYGHLVAVAGVAGADCELESAQARRRSSPDPAGLGGREATSTPTAAAAGEIVAELLQRWGVEIDQPIATALYLAVASDTGWFQFSNTRPYTMRLAATLMEAGVDTDRLYQLLYQNERAERVALQARAMQSMELLCR